MRKREIERGRARKRDINREREIKRDINRERERETERCPQLLFLFLKGMMGALARFSCLVIYNNIINKYYYNI